MALHHISYWKILNSLTAQSESEEQLESPEKTATESATLKGVEKEKKISRQIREGAVNQFNPVTLRRLQPLLVNCFKDCEFDVVNILHFF